MNYRRADGVVFHLTLIAQAHYLVKVTNEHVAWLTVARIINMHAESVYIINMYFHIIQRNEPANQQTRPKRPDPVGSNYKIIIYNLLRRVQEAVPVSCCVMKDSDSSEPEPVDKTQCYAQVSASSSKFIHTQVRS